MTGAGEETRGQHADIPFGPIPKLSDPSSTVDDFEHARTIARVRTLAESWLYDGRYGYDDGSHATGPGPEDVILDGAAHDLLRLLDGADTGHGDQQ